MTEVIRIEPRASSAWSVLAACYRDLGDHAKALQLRVMAAHLRHDVDEWGVLAKESKEMGFEQQELYCYGKLCALDPGNVDALWDRAMSAKDMGELRIVSFRFKTAVSVECLTTSCSGPAFFRIDPQNLSSQLDGTRRAPTHPHRDRRPSVLRSPFPRRIRAPHLPSANFTTRSSSAQRQVQRLWPYGNPHPGRFTYYSRKLPRRCYLYQKGCEVGSRKDGSEVLGCC